MVAKMVLKRDIMLDRSLSAQDFAKNMSLLKTLGHRSVDKEDDYFKIIVEGGYFYAEVVNKDESPVFSPIELMPLINGMVLFIIHQSVKNYL